MSTSDSTIHSARDVIALSAVSFRALTKSEFFFPDPTGAGGFRNLLSQSDSLADTNDRVSVNIHSEPSVGDGLGLIKLTLTRVRTYTGTIKVRRVNYLRVSSGPVIRKSDVYLCASPLTVASTWR